MSCPCRAFLVSFAGMLHRAKATPFLRRAAPRARPFGARTSVRPAMFVPGRQESITLSVTPLWGAVDRATSLAVDGPPTSRPGDDESALILRLADLGLCTSA